MIITTYKHPVLFYFLATVIPWAFWFAAGYVSHLEPHGDTYVAIASLLAFIGLLGPMGVAYCFISKDPVLRVDVLRRFFNCRSIKPVYLVLACCLMLVSILVAQAISLLFGYSSSQFAITGHFTFSSGVFPVWMMLIIAPILEELGWHSYGTDCLRNRMNLFKIWHIPLSTIRDYYQSNLVETGWIHGVNFLVSIIPYTLLMNWLYYKTGRSIVVAIVFPITAGYFNEIFATHPDSKIIQTALLLLLATAIVVRDKTFFFQKALTNGASPDYKQDTAATL